MTLRPRGAARPAGEEETVDRRAANFDDRAATSRWISHGQQSSELAGRAPVPNAGSSSTRPQAAESSLERESEQQHGGPEDPAERSARPPRQAGARDAVGDGEKPESFDLAAMVASPEFREMHTPLVLDGLELLTARDPRHRALGAMRIGAAGADARTAFPVLRKQLNVEGEKIVRLRIAEAILKWQPNDRRATDCLAELMTDQTDAELRQGAACAFAGAAAGHNPHAVVHLTEALDDANPRVRTMAALTLAQFGPAAADSVPRLEMAASSDVPRVQQAAAAALAAITKRPVQQPASPRPAQERPAAAKGVSLEDDEDATRPLIATDAQDPADDQSSGRALLRDLSRPDVQPLPLSHAPDEPIQAPAEQARTPAEFGAEAPKPLPTEESGNTEVSDLLLGLSTNRAANKPADASDAPKPLAPVDARPIRKLRIEPAEHHHVPSPKPPQTAPPQGVPPRPTSAAPPPLPADPGAKSLTP